MTTYTRDLIYSEDFSDAAYEIGSVDDEDGFDRVAIAQTEALAERIVVMLNTPAPQPTRAAKWISTVECEGEDIFFVMIDTVRDVPDLEGPYDTLKKARDMALAYSRQVYGTNAFRRPTLRVVSIATEGRNPLGTASREARVGACSNRNR